MTQELRPLFYTSQEGGSWIAWPEDVSLDIDDLAKRTSGKEGHAYVVISGILLHSIAFGHILAGWNNFIRWDCTNGFTDEPEEVIYQTIHHLSPFSNLPKDFLCQIRRTEMLEEFKTFAYKKGISLKNQEDYIDWYRCWADGFNTALRQFSIWNDGVQRIGAMETDIKEILIKE